MIPEGYMPVVLIFGNGGDGKTSFITRYCPDPMTIFSYDRRSRKICREAELHGRKVEHIDLHMPATTMTPEQATEAGKKVVNATIKKLEALAELGLKRKHSTVGIDTGSELSAIIKYSFDGVQEETKKGAYGVAPAYIKDQWWRIVNLCRDGNLNLVIASRAKEIWKVYTDPATGKKIREATGKFTFRCPDVCNDAADWAAHVRFNGSKKCFEMQMKKCGDSIAERGVIYRPDDWGEYGAWAYACFKQSLGTQEPIGLDEWMEGSATPAWTDSGGEEE